MREYNEDFIQYSDKKVKDETKNLALYFTIHISLYILLFFFLIFFAWYTVFITTHRFYAVYGISMKNTLNSQIPDYTLNAEDLSFDAVYIDKFGELNINDIIVLEKEEDTKIKSVIKRLLAVEGDYITIAKTQNLQGEEYFSFYRIDKNTEVKNLEFDEEMFKVDEVSGVNGYSIYSVEEWANAGETVFDGIKYETQFFNKFLNTENFLDDYPYETITSANGMIFVKVPQDKFFYMGDNRVHSTDAREKGFADVSQIVGRCVFIVKDYNFGNRILSVIKYYFNQVEEFFAR